MNTALLEIEKVSKIFGGVHAVEGVSFNVSEHAICALIGTNGAGKSTLFNLITNIYPCDQGDIRFRGESIRGWPPHQIARAGVMRTFQTARVFPHLTVLDNVLAGAHVAIHANFFQQLLATVRSRHEERKLRDRAFQLLDVIGLAERAQDPASILPLAEQKNLELARVLMPLPALLLLDEPAAGLIDQETVELAQLLRGIRDSGRTILLVEHNMSMVMGIADYVVVMDAGRVIAQGQPADVQRHPQVVEAFFGRGAGSA